MNSMNLPKDTEVEHKDPKMQGSSTSSVKLMPSDGTDKEEMDKNDNNSIQ